MKTESDPALSVLMPVFNERDTVIEAIDRLAACDFGVQIELVVVDDGSDDGTTDLVRERAWSEQWIHTVHHPRNRGKGAAIRSAIDQATGGLVCIYDADLECDPADMAVMLKLALDSTADVIYGLRDFSRGEGRLGLYALGNRFVTACCNLLFRSNLHDIMTCYKLMPLDVLRSLNIRSDRFDLEPEVTAKLLARGHRIMEIPVSYQPRTHKLGKKLRPYDAWSVLYTLLRVRVSGSTVSQPLPGKALETEGSMPHELR